MTTSTHHPRFHQGPQSQIGRWAVSFAGVFVAALLFLIAMTAVGQEGGDRLSDNLWLGIPGVTAGVSGIASFASGMVALIRGLDRSVSVVIATAIGALATVFLLGEVFFPH